MTETLSITRNRGGLIRKTAFGLGLTAAVLSSGCAANESTAPKQDTAPTTATTEAKSRGEEMWHAAVNEMRGKVDNDEKVLLMVARGTCIAWPNIVDGAYTVQRNPAMYGYTEGKEQLQFFPFVPSTSDGSNVIMNGPYNYQAYQGAPSFGNAGAVIFEKHPYLFEGEEHVFEVKQEPNPTPYTAGWLEAEDGTRIAETRIIEGDRIDEAFDGQCDIILEQPEPVGPVLN